MKRGKISRIIFSGILIVCALWVAVPKVYVHQLLGHNHGLISNTLETSVQNEVKDDCEFDKYDSPVYFTIFKFINNLLPAKPKEQSYVLPSAEKYNNDNAALYLLRGPPLA